MSFRLVAFHRYAGQPEPGEASPAQIAKGTDILDKAFARIDNDEILRACRYAKADKLGSMIEAPLESFIARKCREVTGSGYFVPVLSKEFVQAHAGYKKLESAVTQNGARLSDMGILMHPAFNSIIPRMYFTIERAP